jgi:hypothetical protein
MKLLNTLLAILPIQTACADSKIASGIDLLSEMSELQESLTRLQTLLNDKAVAQDKELVNKSAKLFRRARWLIYSSNHEMGHKKGTQNAQHLRGGIGSGEMDIEEGKSMDGIRAMREDEVEDHVARNMYDAVRSSYE